MKKILTIALACTCLLAQQTQAYFQVNLPGNTEFSGWDTLTAANYPGYPPSTPFGPPPNNNPYVAWPEPIAPNVSGSSSSVELDKVGGPGNPGSGGLYSFADVTTYSLTSSTPLASLETLLFQIDIGRGEDGIYFDALPTLNLNGDTQNFTADFTAWATGAFEFNNPQDPEDPLRSRIWAYQWDLSGFEDPITSYELNWTVYKHSTTYTMQLNSGDTMAQVVPEPSSALLLVAALAGLAARRLRHRNKLSI